MQRALDLAQKGLGFVSPNPMVGCVIVHDNKTVGEGWHKNYGGKHAEVNAIDSLENKEIITESTVYVTLEPCSFYGKTPACTDLLIKHNPQLVVVASKDPNPKVSGNGIKLLKQAGISVEFGILEKEAITLNKRFFVAMQENRPYVILKWAQTSDNFIARSDYSSKWISNEYSRQLVHKWRTEEDAILVGYNTVKYDNPELTARNWEGRNPVRVVIDPGLDLNQSFKIFGDSEEVYVFNSKVEKSDGNLHYKLISESNLAESLLENLYKNDIGSVIIEGGSKTINDFIDQGLWDEARVFSSQQAFGDGISAPNLHVKASEEIKIEEDNLKIIYNPESSTLWQKN